MHQQLWGYKVEEKLYVGVREQKRLNTAGADVPEYLTAHLSNHIPDGSPLLSPVVYRRKPYAMNAYGEMEIYIQSFLTVVLTTVV
jgi:hypothetical protein